MNSYFVARIRTTEYQGTLTESTLGVYRIQAWNLDEARKTAQAIPTAATYEYLRFSSAPPEGHEVQELQ